MQALKGYQSQRKRKGKEREREGEREREESGEKRTKKEKKKERVIKRKDRKEIQHDKRDTIQAHSSSSRDSREENFRGAKLMDGGVRATFFNFAPCRVPKLGVVT